MGFLDTVFKNKKVFLLIISTLMLSPLVASAGIWEDIVSVGQSAYSMINGGALDMARGIVAALISILASFSVTILNMSLDFLNWTASGDFIQGNMVNVMDNPMVSIGWTALRNVANIMLIFGLVAVAISIMLEYQETKAKKMLINFVIIALLINFTPVICGVLIDAANVLMNIFLKGGVSGEFVKIIQQNSETHKLEDIAALLVIVIFSLLASFIYILYGLLFMFRYIQLWILIIISPIAFASKVFMPTGASKYMGYILPDQCQWDPWWKDFLNWTFIGVPAAFSIYLSNVLMQATTANATSIVSAPTGSLSGLFSGIFSALIPFGVLIQGFIMTMNKGNSDMFNMGSKLQGVYNKGTKLARDKITETTKSGFNRGREIASAGLEGMSFENFSNSYKTRRDDLRASGKRGARIRGFGTAALSSAKDFYQGASTVTSTKSIEEEVKENNEKKAAEKKEYDLLKDADNNTITQILSKRNLSSPQAADRYSAALRIYLERGNNVDEFDKDFLADNGNKLTQSAKLAAAKKDSNLAVKLLDSRDMDSSNAILSELASSGKAHMAREWLDQYGDFVNDDTQKAVQKSNAEFKAVFNKKDSKIFNPAATSGHQELIREKAIGQNNSKHSKGTNVVIASASGSISFSGGKGKEDAYLEAHYDREILSAKTNRTKAEDDRLNKAIKLIDGIDSKGAYNANGMHKGYDSSDWKEISKTYQSYQQAETDLATLSKNTSRTPQEEAKYNSLKAVVEEWTSEEELKRLKAILVDPTTSKEKYMDTLKQIKQIEAGIAKRQKELTLRGY